MPVYRFFTCTACGHHLRFGAARCGDCRRPTPLLNRFGFLAVLAGGALLLVVAMALG